MLETALYTLSRVMETIERLKLKLLCIWNAKLSSKQGMSSRRLILNSQITIHSQLVRLIQCFFVFFLAVPCRWVSCWRYCFKCCRSRSYFRTATKLWLVSIPSDAKLFDAIVLWADNNRCASSSTSTWSVITTLARVPWPVYYCEVCYIVTGCVESGFVLARTLMN